MNADGSRLARLTKNHADDTTPLWSSDGRRIVFTSDRSGDFDVYTINPTGKGLRRLTRTVGDDRFPVWSSDSRRIAFIRERVGASDVYVTDEHGEARRLTRALWLGTQASGRCLPRISVSGQRDFALVGAVGVHDDEVCEKR
jgi:Tol biopolymer transport system component